METSADGLRVLTGRNPYFSGNPQLVIFKMDADTLSFLEVHGSPEGLSGFSIENWFEPCFWPGRVHPDDREAALKFCAECSKDRRDHELEFRIVRQDGEVRWVHEIVEFSDPEASSIGTGYIMDITRRVAQEADVRSVIGLKEELFRVVVEDINQPVRKIANFGDMLVRHLSAQGDDVGSDYALGLREGLQELGTLIEGLQRAGRNGDANFHELAEKLATLNGRDSNGN